MRAIAFLLCVLLGLTACRRADDRVVIRFWAMGREGEVIGELIRPPQLRVLLHRPLRHRRRLHLLQLQRRPLLLQPVLPVRLLARSSTKRVLQPLKSRVRVVVVA